jgi:hypothetical protein
MKKKQLIIISLLVVAIIFVISLFYPPAEESDSAGTIGKVDKYRSSETGQEKIVLRNEFLQDTTALKNVIITLQMYENYISTLSNDFKEWETSLKNTNSEILNLDKQIEELNLLSVFMENNLSTVTNTRELLLMYFIKDTVDMSIDVQNNLIQFSGFVTNLDEKSKVVDELFLNLTGIIESDKLTQLELTKEQTETLKEVREKMLGGIVYTAITLGNQERLNMALNSNVLNLLILNKQLNNTFLGTIVPFAKANLGLFNSDKLDNVMQAIYPFGAKEKLAAWNKEQLSIFLNKEQLGLVYGNKLNEAHIQNIETIDANLGALLNNPPLGRILNKEELGIITYQNSYVFSKESVGSLLFNEENLGYTVFAKDNLGGIVLLGKEGLQMFMSYSNTFNAFVGNRIQLGLK